jgi:hypothetical protein
LKKSNYPILWSGAGRLLFSYLFDNLNYQG